MATLPEIPKIFWTTEILPMRVIQDRYINWVMECLNNDQEAVAARLEISPRTIYNRIKHGNVQDPK